MGLIALVWRRHRPPARQVEAPNSHFNPPTVRYVGPASPWDQLDLSALHEVNREAVSTLLDKVRALGPDSLSEPERDLMIRMAAAVAAAGGATA